MSLERGVTLAVIAGGAGSRMGRPKWKMEIEGRPALARLRERLSWTGPTVLVLGPSGENPNDEASASFSTEVFDLMLRDERPGSGPVAGILTALRRCQSEWMACVPVDMPGLRGSHLRWLVERGVERGCSCAMLRRGPGNIEPFPTLVRRDSLAHIEAMCDVGPRAMRDLGQMPGAVILDAPLQWGDEAWVNLNTPHDVAEFSRARDTMTRAPARPRVAQEGGGP